MRIERHLYPYVRRLHHSQTASHGESLANHEEPILVCRVVNDVDFDRVNLDLPQLIKLRFKIQVPQESINLSANFVKNGQDLGAVIFRPKRGKLIQKIALDYCGDGALFDGKKWKTFTKDHPREGLQIDTKRSQLERQFEIQADQITVQASSLVKGYHFDPPGLADTTPIFPLGAIYEEGMTLDQVQQHFAIIRPAGNRSLINEYAAMRLVELGLIPSKEEVQRCHEFGACKIIARGGVQEFRHSVADSIYKGFFALRLNLRYREVALKAIFYHSIDFSQHGQTPFLDVTFKREDT